MSDIFQILWESLQQADAFRVAGDVHDPESRRADVQFDQAFSPIGDPENQVMRISWVDEDGLCVTYITEHGLSNAKADVDGSLVLQDFAGGEVRLYAYQLAPVAFPELT